MPPSAVMFPTGIVLIQSAAPVAITSKRTSHDPKPAILAPCMVIELAPTTADVKLAVPAQVEAALTGFANTIPAGNGSVTDTFVNATAPELDNRIETRDFPPAETAVGLNDLFANKDDK